jgi:hypothetical protein
MKCIAANTCNIIHEAYNGIYSEVDSRGFDRLSDLITYYCTSSLCSAALCSLTRHISIQPA